MQASTVPFYSFDNSYADHITVRRAERLEALGRVKIVRNRVGSIKRVIELRGQNDPKPTAIRDYVDQAYSHRQHLSDGRSGPPFFYRIA